MDQRAQEIATQAEQLLTSARAFIVQTPEVYQLAADELKFIKGKAKELDDMRKSMTRPLDESKNKIMEFFRPAETWLKQSEQLLKQHMLTYQQEEERKRREAQRLADEAARNEQDRLNAIAEKKAVKQEAKGNMEKASEIRQVVPQVIIPTIVAETPKINGISMRKVWKWREVNSTLVPREYLLLNEKMLSQFARATQGNITVPGIEFYSEEVIGSTTK